MAGVLEYLCAEVLELGVGMCQQKKKLRLVPSHINLGIRSDEELSKLMCNMVVAQGTCVPNIHSFLLPRTKKDAMKADPS